MELARRFGKGLDDPNVANVREESLGVEDENVLESDPSDSELVAQVCVISENEVHPEGRVEQKVFVMN